MDNEIEQLKMDIKDWRHVVEEKSALIQSLNDSIIS